ncbi:major facilitator superfamily transporter [Grosmannia clavigera kw1407]|uniref:Major facilitator superfamily transporter n=1 Tax=Grosmannia clavigera (strain kw1407 / UAMH 11150) TaxID=655863 RepID=F0XB14_GROCL|nr:major facilitator superfamily transporter [Grosmannia clavigera kw1407]EFX05143.1 major facilitator superfamily transporter [Grosmannia clavigera kw1407]
MDKAPADDSGGSSDSTEAPPGSSYPKPLGREILLIVTICMAQLMTQAALAMAIEPLHIIGASFNVSTAGELSWYASAYSLTVGTFILIAGRLGDDFGHRRLFIVGFAWFGLWSLLAGFSVWSNQIFFDCCRAFQGIGPAMLMPNAVALLGRMYAPGPRKSMVFSLFGAAAPTGYSVGAAMSSLLAERLWWPWAYWIMGIVCFGLAVLGTVVIPKSPAPKIDRSLHWASRLDLAGSAAIITGLILINFSWNQGPVVGWDVPYIYVLLIVGFLPLGLFGFIERRAARPLLPPALFTRELGWVLGCIGAGWSSFGVVVFYYFQIMEVIKHNSPLLVSAKWSGSTVSGALASLATGFLMARIRPSLIMLGAMTAFVVGQILLATLPIGQNYWAQAFVISIITPWGMDMSFPSGTLILSNSMPREHQGIAASVVNTVVNYSVSIGLGIAGTVEAYVGNHGEDVLKGYRAASYTGVGLAGLGVLIASLYVILG